MYLNMLLNYEVLMIVIILANSADPDKMPRYVEFNMDHAKIPGNLNPE